MRLNPLPQNPDTIVTGIPQSGFAMNEGDGAYADGPGLPHVNKVVLVMDLVESVRLMALDESGVVARWTGFVQKAQKLIPRYNGRVVKSLGDGLLADFDTARDAALAAAALHKIIQPANRGRNPDQHLFLRIGINAAKVYTGQDELYGAGVNLAARLATLAGPGETMVSASVRDQLTDGLDVDVEDMGECYLKHIETPVRAYRIGPPGPRPVLVPESDYAAQLQPTIAVIPFTSRSNAPEHFAIGELIADGVIGQLSYLSNLVVISRLSARGFRDRAEPAKVQTMLGATYFLRGSYVVPGNARNGKLIAFAELIDARNEQVVWSVRLTSTIGDLLADQCELTNEIAKQAAAAILDQEVRKSLFAPLPTLESYSLLLSGVTLMHRSSVAEFDRGRQVLEHLVDRHPDKAEPRAWLAKWYVLKMVKGITQNSAHDERLAMTHVNRALDADPRSSLAHAIAGHIHCQMRGDFTSAMKSFDLALAQNPNESYAWLFRSLVLSQIGEHELAISDTIQANRNSPVDPIRYFFDLMSASAQLAAGNLKEAIYFANRSLRQNRHHSPTLRTLLTAQVESNDLIAARQTLQYLYREEPALTVQGYLDGGNSKIITRTRCAQALRIVGVSEN